MYSDVYRCIQGYTRVYKGIEGYSRVDRGIEVFRANVGKMEGEYYIRIDTEVDPLQNASSRVPVALRDKLKETLDDLHQQDIIEAVTIPTAWVSSMVVVPKANGKLRICLDPQDLNRAILREHYPLPTVEDVATHLYGAKHDCW